ncbi:MAG: hypothetical protein K6T78_06695 [Alicyclobacillus sp.]|nr:hypothetical protein [Alicyclobacillus sp.]
MKYVPIPMLVAAAVLVIGAWPSVEAWAEATAVHHYLVHILFLASGSLIGLQTARWSAADAPSTVVDRGVTS